MPSTIGGQLVYLKIQPTHRWVNAVDERSDLAFGNAVFVFTALILTALAYARAKFCILIPPEYSFFGFLVYQQHISSVMKRFSILFAVIFAGTLAIAGPITNPSSVASSVTEKESAILHEAADRTGVSYQELEDCYNRGEAAILPAANGAHEVRLLDADGNPVISVVISEL
ncbi:MAG: hypothetical protein AAGN35_23215 [Bacteroidota bacterium]